MERYHYRLRIISGKTIQRNFEDNHLVFIPFLLYNEFGVLLVSGIHLLLTKWFLMSKTYQLT
jgi:hypothetical protein